MTDDGGVTMASIAGFTDDLLAWLKEQSRNGWADFPELRRCRSQYPRIRSGPAGREPRKPTPASERGSVEQAAAILGMRGDDPTNTAGPWSISGRTITNLSMNGWSWTAMRSFLR